ncbi:hypothetical protein LCGC14_1334850 [marine sediment metagenome]|uniref:Uncharacterized protein n=1 Tax=marine sediment metagenome TaxID=412755 RepID=A0A0F9KFD6_9ZZZZ
MKGQAKVHTMRVYTSGTIDSETLKKVADRTFKYTLSKVWEEANIDNIRTANIAAQAQLAKYAKEQNEDGTFKYTDSQCITFANSITFASVAPGELQRGKTDMEKAADLFARLTVEESAAVIKADKERRKAEVAA